MLELGSCRNSLFPGHNLDPMTQFSKVSRLRRSNELKEPGVVQLYAIHRIHIGDIRSSVGRHTIRATRQPF